jgi:hypothetical protein
VRQELKVLQAKQVIQEPKVQVEQRVLKVMLVKQDIQELKVL